MKRTLVMLTVGLLAFSMTGFASHPWLLPEMQLRLLLHGLL